jgi:hypothetical protein
MNLEKQRVVSYIRLIHLNQLNSCIAQTQKIKEMEGRLLDSTLVNMEQMSKEVRILIYFY